MSIAAGLIDSEKAYKSFHRRNDSGELDVFEATGYFSGYNEGITGYNNSTSFSQKMIMREERHGHKGRISLDMPVRNLLPQQFHGVVVEKQMKEKKNSKQPSSPGGRLASFLNSLFSQSASKKKKKSSKSSSQSMKDEDESPGGRRRRRSSISHFRSSSSSTTNADSNKSIYSSLSSGFRTPPYIQTPTKGCREFKSSSDSDQKPAVSLSKCNGTSQAKSSALQDDQLLWDEKKKRNLTWLEENQKYGNEVSEKHRNLGNEFPEREKIWVGKYFPEEKEFRKFSTTEVDIDDGAESDSSSDLFELQNYDLGYCSSGLPVYETTNMDNIKRSAAAISNGPL